MRIETQLAQLGSNKETNTGAISYPVYYSTTYRHAGLGQSTGYDYTRTANPTRAVLEEAIARLEGGTAGFACSSGMAAVQTVMGLFARGDHLIVSLDLYGGTYRLFESLMTRYGLSFSYVDFRRLDEVKAAIRPETRAFFVETPTNPLLQVTDLRAVCEIARCHGLITIVDNTFMTPYFQRPIECGADIVIHSATKYLGGHNDVLAGLIVTKGDELSEQMAGLHNAIGAVLGPQDSWLLLRGMKTLALRMEKHQENAYQLAHFLRQHPLVDEVYYPALQSETWEVQTKQADGGGGMLSFRVKSPALVGPLLSSLRLIAFAESLGGVETLITYPHTQTHADIPEETRRKVGVCDRLLRLSVGIEYVDDLIADLAQALDQAERVWKEEKRDEVRDPIAPQW